MPRRGSNIYKRKDGRFEGRVPIGHKEDGSLKYKFVYARTLSEVKEKMAQFQAVLQNQPVSALKLTVAEASRQWLSAAKLRVKPSSYAHYENIIRNHILPDLGTKYLTDMTTHQLNDFVYEKLQSGRLCGTGGLSARFVQDIMRVYHSIEQYAVQEYHIRGTHFTMPKAEKKQLDVLSSEERKKLEQYLLQTGLTIDLAILLCLFTGLRVGELCVSAASPRRSRMCTSVTAKPSRSRSRARTPASFVVFPALFSQSAFASMARSVRIPIFPTSSPCDLTLSLLRGEIFLQKSRKKD